MAKLRKMLGSIESPHIISLMRVIETQSKETLADWALEYAKTHFLPIYEAAYPEDKRFRDIISAVEEWINGTMKAAEVRPVLKEAGLIAKEAEGNPAAQAAARATATACGTFRTPTNALGFTFYGAAAIAYDRLGLEADREAYDLCAEEELEKMLKSLQEKAVPDEKNPVKVNWNC
ncbi:MAG: hypothetical protein Q4F21_10370 [Lachnospiraceae bacterium]|nr:hypothetical protein [Lachnospiraceae bacterium]